MHAQLLSHGEQNEHFFSFICEIIPVAIDTTILSMEGKEILIEIDCIHIKK